MENRITVPFLGGRISKAILLFFFSSLLLVVGCTPKYMQGMLNNQYFEKTTYVDADAPYIGEWTVAAGPGLTAIKIDVKGNIKVCSSNPYFGTSNGKVFKENGKIKMIFESGDQYELLSVQKDHLIVDMYGKTYKYYSGKVPDNCKSVFDKFSSQ